MLHARNRGVVSIFIHALSENTAMLKIARDAGATVHRDGPETEAWLALPPDSSPRTWTNSWASARPSSTIG